MRRRLGALLVLCIAVPAVALPDLRAFGTAFAARLAAAKL
jgi:hypothetical protein